MSKGKVACGGVIDGKRGTGVVGFKAGKGRSEGGGEEGVLGA
jgi:hypothetical protein